MVTFVIMRILVVRTFRLSSLIWLGKVSYFRISSSKRAPEVPTTMNRSDKTLPIERMAFRFMVESLCVKVKQLAYP